MWFYSGLFRAQTLQWLLPTVNRAKSQAPLKSSKVRKWPLPFLASSSRHPRITWAFPSSQEWCRAGGSEPKLTMLGWWGYRISFWKVTSVCSIQCLAHTIGEMVCQCHYGGTVSILRSPYSLVAHVFACCSPVAVIPIILAHRIPGFPLRWVNLEGEAWSIEANCSRRKMTHESLTINPHLPNATLAPHCPNTTPQLFPKATAAHPEGPWTPVSLLKSILKEFQLDIQTQILHNGPQPIIGCHTQETWWKFIQLSMTTKLWQEPLHEWAFKAWHKVKESHRSPQIGWCQAYGKSRWENLRKG